MADDGQSLAEEIAILEAGEDLQIAGETIRVAEFTFLQALRLSADAAPMIEALNAVFVGDDIGLSELNVVFASNELPLMKLLSVSTGKPISWITDLNDTDGQTLLMTFWRVNKSFFLNRLLARRTQASQPATASPASTTS